jgi:NAD(P)-dependent dehydrogenase (short-subunit alcohol dehydrogenase family)
MQRSILVSGAGGGIGKAGSLQLAKAGFTVFAGAINEAEMDELRALHQNIKPVLLDVTQQESIRMAIQFVTNALDGDKLFGYWNNAGIMRIAAFKNLPVSEILNVINVNLTGCLLMVHASMPLLERGNSRVVITGSATGMLAGPAVSVYTATKWGIEGFVDALRIELGCIGIRLSLIQPGLVKSPMSVAATPAVDALVNGMSQEDRQDYEKLVRTIANTSAKASTMPEQVATAVVEAFTSANPKVRYRVGPDSKAVGVLRHFPDSVKDFIQRKVFGL